jgi:amidophosphoribosyltransferase
MKGHLNVMGEILLGHLRYGTQGKNDVEFCHPFIKKNTIPFPQPGACRKFQPG